MSGLEIIEFISNGAPLLLSTVEKISVALLSVIFLRKNTADKEFEKLKAGKLQETVDELLDNGKMTYTEYYKAKNYLSIVKKADELYTNKECIKTELYNYDFDWFVRFYETVGNVSDNDVQNVWARILAGEIECPGTYSLRTLEKLKNLSRKEAEVFTKIASLSFRSSNIRFIFKYDKLLEEYNISLENILEMEDCGLMCSQTLFIEEKLGKDEKSNFLANNIAVCVINKLESEEKYCIPIFKFTSSGMQLLNAIKIDYNENFIIKIIKKFKKDNENRFLITAHRITQIHGDCFTNDEKDLLV